jgi:hypothetical protein
MQQQSNWMVFFKIVAIVIGALVVLAAIGLGLLYLVCSGMK